MVWPGVGRGRYFSTSYLNDGVGVKYFRGDKWLGVKRNFAWLTETIDIVSMQSGDLIQFLIIWGPIKWRDRFWDNDSDIQHALINSKISPRSQSIHVINKMLIFNGIFGAVDFIVSDISFLACTSTKQESSMVIWISVKLRFYQIHKFINKERALPLLINIMLNFKPF